MSEIPADRHYAESHEWIRDHDDGCLTVGISDHAQDALGDLVFVELPEIGRQCAAGEACAVVESVKAASDIYSPLDGEVVAVNARLRETPELINSDAYGEGWLFRLKPADAGQRARLLDATGYARLLAETDTA